MQSGATAGRASSRQELRERGQAVVLVVDDYQDCREMYAAYLALAGFRVLKASDGLEAVDLVRRMLPDVVLMDLSLPGIDGCEATRRLKSDSLTRDVPVIALTAQSLQSLDELGRIGFEAVLGKPCLPDDLTRHIEAALAARGRRPVC